MTLSIAHLSDSHISVNVPQRATDLELCIEHINAERPHIVVHTGDISHDGLPEEYVAAKTLLDRLAAPFYVLPGNRDNRSELIRAFADDQTIQRDNKFIQYSVEHLPVRMLMLDTHCETSNKGQLCPARLAHFDQMLAQDTSRNVIVFMHHTPFKATEIPDPFQFEHWNDVEIFSTLLKKYNNISKIFCGHVHRNIEGRVAGLQVKAISCIAGDLRKGEVRDSDRALPMYKIIEPSKVD